MIGEASANLECPHRAMVARWVRDLTPGQSITCGIDHDVPGCWYAWVLIEDGAYIAMVEPGEDEFLAISKWLEAQEEAGRLCAIACGTYAHPLHDLATARLTTRH